MTAGAVPELAPILPGSKIELMQLSSVGILRHPDRSHVRAKAVIEINGIGG